MNTVSPIAAAIFRPRRLALLALGIGAAVLGSYFLPRMPPLDGRPEYRVQTAQIQLVPAPSHPVPMDLIEQVRVQNRLPRDLSLLDPKLSQTLAEAFRKHPWIERVVSVSQSYPSQVQIRLEYRMPVATVQVDGGRVPIDRQGTLLPSDDFSAADVARYPVIRLESGRLMTRAGSRITEPRVADAAALAELLAPRWQAMGFEFIEIPGRPATESDVRYYLQCRSGSRILWGRGPGTSHPGELSAAQKVARLERYLAEFGGFDRPNGPYEIDIRHWQEITRRPQARTQAAVPRKNARTR